MHQTTCQLFFKLEASIRIEVEVSENSNLRSLGFCGRTMKMRLRKLGIGWGGGGWFGLN